MKILRTREDFSDLEVPNVRENLFVDAVRLTSRKLWSRPMNPPLVTRSGQHLGGAGGAQRKIKGQQQKNNIVSEFLTLFTIFHNFHWGQNYYST